VGGRLFFPSGTYLVNNLAANVANQTWELADGAVIKMKTGATNAIYVTADNVTLIGGTVDAANGTAHNGAQHPVRIDADGCTIRNLTVLDSPLYGVVFYNSSRVTVTGCTMVNSYSGGIWVQNSMAGPSNIYDINITDNRVDSTDGGNSAAGIGLYGSSITSRIKRIVISGNIIAIPYEQTDRNTGCVGAVNCSDFVIANNVCEGGEISISVPDARQGTISHNTVRGFRSYGIELPGNQDGVSVVGNVIDSDGLDGNSGIATNTGTHSNISISGNTIKNMTATESVLIRFDSGSVVNGVSVTGNTLRSDHDGFTGILSNGSVSNLTISGNVFDGLTATNSRAMEFLNSVDGLTVSGNQFTNLTVAAVRVGTGSAVTQDNIRVIGNGYVNCGAVFLDSNYGAGSGALGANVSTDATPIFTSIQLGNNTDTTLSRSSAGVLAVEGVAVPTISSSSTLTNKTITSPKVNQINDTNGNTLLAFSPTANAVNNFRFYNAATGGPVFLVAEGSDAAVSFNIQATGEIRLVTSGGNLVKINGNVAAVNSTSVAFTTQQVELGHANDTTVSRSAAGVAAVEGNPVSVRVSVPGTSTTAGKPGYTYTGDGSTHTWVRATAATW
jgi:parallel beta-helix repeat protein